MKIALHSNQFDGRGSGKVPYDYATALRDILGHEVTFITSGKSKNEGSAVITKEFPMTYYALKVGEDKPSEISYVLSQLVEKEKIDFMYMLKAGENDGIDPTNCKVGIHCVFSMTQPHGNSYAGVSHFLANKFGKTDYVPHIITNYAPTENLRAKYGIPADALVYGRHGGMDTFDVPFVYQCIRQILQERKDVYFLFLSTQPFIQHERVIFIPWVGVQQDIFNFIHSCDAMIHARMIGETFGLAVGEFSVANKPVLTNSFGTDKAHIEHLGDRALQYSNASELMDLFRAIDRPYCLENDWDMFSVPFSRTNVINKFNEVFLK
jgi:hypothetical protein